MCHPTCVIARRSISKECYSLLQAPPLFPPLPHITLTPPTYHPHTPVLTPHSSHPLTPHSSHPLTPHSSHPLTPHLYHPLTPHSYHPLSLPLTLPSLSLSHNFFKLENSVLSSLLSPQKPTNLDNPHLHKTRNTYFFLIKAWERLLTTITCSRVKPVMVITEGTPPPAR